MFLELKNNFLSVGKRRIDTLIDQARVNIFSVETDGLFFDYSKTNIDLETRSKLLELVINTDVISKRDAMFSGKKINLSEDRAVLHTALRKSTGQVFVDGEDVIPAVLKTRTRMFDFSDDVQTGKVSGQGGKYTDVVNIGIGGSDLGPAMAYLALKPYKKGPKCHYVSNIDGAHIHDVLSDLNPETTLVIVASKTFTTIETLTNAKTAFNWMAESVLEPGTQFVALSSSKEKTAEFGIPNSQLFGFEDWVGGRYSLWGPIGLSLVIAIGKEHFSNFLNGAQSMDLHFQNTEKSQNLPIIMALVGIWHAQICGYTTRAILPYEQRLSRLPAYLQQLEMESNGKGVGIEGKDLLTKSGPIVWGEPGTNGQHAFYQLIHQGTHIVPCEFMIAKQGHEAELKHHHQLLQANCLAQSQALMSGRNIEKARSMADSLGFLGTELEQQARQRVFEGNRPSTTLVYPKLTPFCLGQIIALYEHRVFVEGVILGINSFDQWGVELGKELATELAPVLEGSNSATHYDLSTQNLVSKLSSK
ncbi:glucose-6-phosphate isomerase [Planktomarina sp.]|jgi:glucose-6-phosphate isomerase|nr:glucose-6-phosphate isomerase [Planktomarina sp.]MDB9924410.1 glucose-6-phosphate isomerase [Planktomarina sp.]